MQLRILACKRTLQASQLIDFISPLEGRTPDPWIESHQKSKNFCIYNRMLKYYSRLISLVSLILSTHCFWQKRRCFVSP